MYKSMELSDRVDAKPVYTIGYGNRLFDEFATLLHRRTVDVVCDVRSTPYSHRYPEYTRDELRRILPEEGMRYLFLGDLLGARPSDARLFDSGRASYKLIADSDHYQRGIDRVEAGRANFTIALMCAERQPMDCHRAVLIARTLVSRGIPVVHIGSDGLDECHADFEARLIRRYGLQQTSIFDPTASATALSEAYERRSVEIAFARNASSGSEH